MSEKKVKGKVNVGVTIVKQEGTKKETKKYH